MGILKRKIDEMPEANNSFELLQEQIEILTSDEDLENEYQKWNKLVGTLVKY